MGVFTYSVSKYTPASKFKTEGLFDNNYMQSTKSAIDDFVEKRISLFKLIRPYENDIQNLPYELTNLIFLGCISAVESYIRKIIRSLINVDLISRKNCEERTLKYGAVISYKDTSMLPEALLEEYSFANGKNIKDTIKTFLNVKCDNIQPLDTVFSEFSSICELRHCVVHRFGLLGSNNAIKLGLSEHQEYIEKPLRIDFEHLNEIVQICDNLVKAINNHLFSVVLERTFTEKSEIWYSDYRKDKNTFMKYLDLFIDSSNSADFKDIYKEFMQSMHGKYGQNYQSI